jgi:hypothetical protein
LNSRFYTAFETIHISRSTARLGICRYICDLDHVMQSNSTNHKQGQQEPGFLVCVITSCTVLLRVEAYRIFYSFLFVCLCCTGRNHEHRDDFPRTILNQNNQANTYAAFSILAQRSTIPVCCQSDELSRSRADGFPID